jgi:hypothetical protein
MVPITKTKYTMCVVLAIGTIFCLRELSVLFYFFINFEVTTSLKP